jgi:hypothetical protein
MALALAGGCSETVTAELQAEQTFAAFQDALFDADARALRQLVCQDARPAVPALCDQDLTGKQRLQIKGVTRRDYEYLVHVRDPNQGDRASHYVLTVERGVMRVDLLATHRDHTQVSRTFLDRPRFVPHRTAPEQVRDAQATRAKARRTDPGQARNASAPR